MMKFSGVLHDSLGQPLTGVIDVTFSLYNIESGGSPLWFETQTVQADELGRYTALLGAMHTEGLPVDLFTSGEVRWLGIQVGSEAEQQPRVLLVSVPYALKAGDAETLGGKPASAYMLSDTHKGTTSTTAASATGTNTAQDGSSGKTRISQTSNQSPMTACSSVTSDGNATANSIALFTTACNLESANLVQFNGNLGFGTTTPQARLHIFGPTSSDSDARFNFILGDSTPAAAGTGGGILFSGYYSGTSLKAGFANIRGVKENNTQGDYATAMIFDTRANGGNQTERMRITSTGSVGIGVTNPGASLEVMGADTQDQDARYNIFSFDSTSAGAGTGGGIGFAGYFNGTSQAAGFAGIRGVKENSTQGDYGSALIFDTRANGLGQAERMRISSTGNVGIGTTTPAAKLDVAGNINASGNITIAGTLSGNGSGLTSLTGANVTGVVSSATNALTLGGVTAANYARLDIGNSLNGNQSVTGNVSVASSASGATALSGQATDATSANIGLSGLADGAEGTGVYGEAENGSTAFGIWGRSTSGYAGHFDGNVQIVGNLSKSGGSFKIDHPLDPARKFLYHSFVESPDMKNIYDGVVTLDDHGEAVVQLPDWFEALNRDFRYQLTCIGGYAPVYIADEVAHHQFRIAGGKPGLKISWQVTGIRQDAWANAHRIPVETEKPAREQGYYLHPELFGAPPEKSIVRVEHEVSTQAAR
ncbi:MAG TPA: hypothetical protein VG028_08155 [Terriglobia bacterium]|nr:hypothetical protein [Terriglobia bacterium]